MTVVQLLELVKNCYEDLNAYVVVVEVDVYVEVVVSVVMLVELTKLALLFPYQ